MRLKFSSFIEERIKKYGYLWFIRQVLRYFRFHIYFRFKKPFTTPINGILITTYRCNCKCSMCRIWGKGGAEEFGTTEMKRLVDELKTAGVDAIGFTGGEPLMRTDIFELIAYAKSKNIYTHLSTNATLLTPEAAKKLLESGLDSVSISLDSPRPGTHNGIKSLGNAHELAVRGIKNMAAERKNSGRGPEIGVVTVISRKNIDSVLEMVEFSDKIGADNIGFMPLYFYDDKYEPGAVDRVIDSLIEMKRKGRKIDNSYAYLKLMKKYLKKGLSPLRCNASFQSVTVDCYGSYYPCFPRVHEMKPVENPGRLPVSDFMRSPAYQDMHKYVSHCKRCCANCHSELNIMFTLKGLWETMSLSQKHLKYQ